jgi:prepilin-type N-terminal cleavage/methylation domain-containing protein
MRKINFPSFREKGKKNAFTLLELLIVIVLMSVVAITIVSSIPRKSAVGSLGIADIGTIADRLHVPAGELVCYDDCKKCLLRIPGQKDRPAKWKASVKGAYTVNRYGEERKIDFGRIGDREICLRFRYGENGSTSRMIIATDSGFYYVPSYFGEARKFPTLRKAVKFWRENTEKMTRRENFY